VTSPQPHPPAQRPAAVASPVPEPPDQLTAADAVVALLAAWVAAQGAQAAARAALTPARILAALVEFGFPRQVARATLQLALQAGVGVPAAPTTPGAVAQRMTARAEPIWRARYLLAAGKRMAAAYQAPPRRPGQRSPSGLVEWTPERMTPTEAARHAFQLERGYLAQHRQAQTNRARAAAEVDAAGARWGDVLGWYATRDSRTTWDCLRLHGKTFRVDDPPGGHYPGAVHARCRCRPGPPWPGARIVGRSGV
jgi:SPP1 gp7 family putative phage head morphogenesis protein